MKIHCLYDKLVSPRELKAHAKNRNKHPDEQIRRLADILDYQGWRYPIKVSNLSGQVTSGHGRIQAALLKGWQAVPVVYQDYTNLMRIKNNFRPYRDKLGANCKIKTSEFSKADGSHQVIYTSGIFCG